jgi:hypothetical protein
MKHLRPFLSVLSVIVILAISSCTKTATAPAFALASPANNSTNLPLNQTFTCTSPANVATYEFNFKDANNYYTGGITTVVNSTTATNLSGNFSSLTSGHSYTWFVRFHLTGGGYEDSPSWSFSVQ